MAELEIHHESEGPPDPTGKRIGVLAALIAVLLAAVTIQSHRTHTEAVVLKSEENDQWSFYQSKRIKQHTIELGTDLLHVMAPVNEATAGVLKRYQADLKKYESDSEKIKEAAVRKEEECVAAEHRALRYDLGEGFLELALVLCSLYFISRKRLFPSVGIIAAILGAGIAATGLWMR
ncbi:MAG TPA: DUF4337 domain-containing protein [Bryobacteraceae bacterium]|nr:DUF4337 domain-containing protein [Bryobacteraceae bacterium]